MEKERELFNTLIKKVAEVLVQEISNEEKAKGWTIAFVDIRGSNTKVSKLRIGFKDKPPKGLLNSSVTHTPWEVDDLFDEVWPARPSFEKMWYGLKVM
jgi:predicted secreted protein